MSPEIKIARRLNVVDAHQQCFYASILVFISLMISISGVRGIFKGMGMGIIFNASGKRGEKS